MEPWIGLALLAGAVAIWVFASRQVARGRRRFAWVFFAPLLLGMAFVVFAAVRLWSMDPLLAAGLGLFGGLTWLVAFRTARRTVSSGSWFEANGGLTRPAEDYFLWMGVVPVLFIGLLLLLLITGGLDSSR